MVIDKAAVEAHFPPLLNYAEDVKTEEDRSSRMLQDRSYGSQVQRQLSLQND